VLRGDEIALQLPLGYGARSVSWLRLMRARVFPMRVLVQHDLASRLIVAGCQAGALGRMAGVLTIGRCPGRPRQEVGGVPAGASARPR
jgi:hypothetical protein